MRVKAVIGAVILIAMLFSSIGVGFSSTNGGNPVENGTATRDLNSGLVAYWNFDEGSGNVLHDVSGHGNDGTIYGATWVKGIRGYALSFDGVDSYVDVPNSDYLAPPTYTVNVWFKPTEPTYISGYGEIITKDLDRLYYQIQWGGTYETTDNEVEFWYEDEYDNDYYLYSDPVSVGVWHMASMEYADGVLIIYMDGKFVDEEEFDVAPYNSGGDLYIAHGDTGFFNGTIDELRIYNRALSADEIKQLYEQYVSQPNNPGGNGMNYLWYIIAGAVITAVIAIVLIIMKKKGETPQPQSYYKNPSQYPPQPPQQGQQPSSQETPPPQYQQTGYPPPPPLPQGEFVNKPQPPPHAVGMITVTCPYCGFTSQIPVSMRGQWVQCPNCGNQFQVP